MEISIKKIVIFLDESQLTWIGITLGQNMVWNEYAQNHMG
jgi:hypothetical protein